MSEGMNLKDTTIKCTSDQKDEVNLIAAELGSNSTQKDAIDHLLRLNRMKREEEAGRTIPRLDDLRYLFSRFEGIYSEMYLSARDQEEHSVQIIEIRSKEIDDLKLRLFEMKEMLENTQQEASQQIEEMNNSVSRIVEEKDSEVNRVRGEIALVKEASEKELEQMRLLVKESQESKEQSS
ncbi:hypothetical protein [Paenibacillus sp. IITD108]|uniref:hypothetical protein n=1 Tax=Paenibacillus sp. IITD108 TaxID=3116649 RepID=UPI002F428E9F